MGALTSRQNPGVEEVDITSNHAYKYPPRSGNYFGSHFIMGGERFDTPQPESYLFGENSDLNFLGSRPTSFPYPPPQANEPTKTLKSLVNIRKESLRFVRAPPDYNKIENDQSDRDLEIGKGSLFNIEFTFDCDVRCAITIYYFCTEDITNNGVTYIPRDATMNSETYHYKRGANQQFCQMSHCFDPSRYSEEELLFNTEKEIIPIAIHCIAEEGSDEIRQSHTTIAVVEKHTDGTYVLKALKQKLFVDGLCYLLQEIYGIENKNSDTKITGDEETEDNGSECVICMCDVRDTLILPCRHLCLCNSCADSLRYQANNCPICRAPFRALLQIRALQKTTNIVQQAPTSPPEGTCDNIPPGYEAVSLIEALNGPCIQPRQPPSAVLDMVETPETESAVAVAVQAAEVLNRVGSDERQNKNGKDDKRNGISGTNNTPEFRMSVLLSRDDELKETQKSPLLADQSGYRSGKNSRPKDTVRHVNEKNTSVEKDETQDEDSEAEKLSPLLHTKESHRRDANLALDMAGVVESIDDTDTEHEDPLNVEGATPTSIKTKIIANTSRSEQEIPVKEERGEESDYYTPEDPAPTILSPLYVEKERERSSSFGVNSSDSTPNKNGAPLASLPGTPLSHISVRSSGDSYGSSSSTRHLLAIVQAPVVMHDKSVQI